MMRTAGRSAVGIVALSRTLDVSPSKLIGMPIAAAGDERTDVVVRAVRSALMAVAHDQPGDRVLPVQALRARVDDAITILGWLRIAGAHWTCARRPPH
ncbi:MAG TPA: hypothetical protein VGJ13_17215 [Pseudonocardiaceae bacterium]